MDVPELPPATIEPPAANGDLTAAASNGHGGNGEPSWSEDKPQADRSPLSPPDATKVVIHLTDVGNGKRLIERHGKVLRCCLPWNKWLCWDGQRWKLDAEGRIVGAAKDTVLSLFSWGRAQIEEIEKQLKEIPEDEPGA